jgi:hypothetical protein
LVASLTFAGHGLQGRKIVDQMNCSAGSLPTARFRPIV